MQHLACPESELEPALRSWSERGIMESKLPIPCRLCGVSFTMESEACAHFDVFHGGLKRYREEFLCLEACRPHVVKGEEWRHILANFSEFSTQAAKSWNERQKQRRAPRSRCMSCCCICARSFWSEELTLAPFAGPDSPILNSSSVAKLLSAKRYFEKWPLYLWEELEASSIVLGGELILVNSKRVPDDALEKDKWSPAPWCQDCSRSLWQKSPKMPKIALAAGCFLGRIQKPFRDMHFGNFEQLQKRRGFAHRLLLPIARPISTKVVLQQDESAPADPWAYAFIQKGLRGSCVLLPNASVADANEFPPADLGEAFVAAFVGADSTDLSKAQFGTVHREEFEEQADFLRKHNARYQRSRYNRDVVRSWPSGESVPAEISNMIVPLGGEEDGIGAMRQKGPAEEVEAESGSAELDESTAWTAALTDVDLSCLPVGGVFAVASAKLAAAERIAVRTTAAELRAQVEDGQGPLSETGRSELLTACNDALKELRKITNLEAEKAKLQHLASRVMGSSPAPDTAADPLLGDLNASVAASAAAPAMASGPRQTDDSTKRLVVPIQGEPVSFFNRDAYACLSYQVVCHMGCIVLVASQIPSSRAASQSLLP